METRSLLKKASYALFYTFAALVTAIALGIMVVSCESKASTDISTSPLSNEELIKRGDYLVSTIGCHDCHSPKVMTPQGPEPDPEKLLSGYPSTQLIAKVNTDALKSWVLFNFDLTSAVGPWGQSFAANISADETGIGNWSEEQFFRALREGKYKGLEGGRPLLPPMPWFVYKNLKDEDLRAIFAYLKSTKPVKNIVPAPISPSDL